MSVGAFTIHFVRWASRVARTASAAEKSVLFVLAQYADEHGASSPGIAQIAEEANVSPRSAKRATAGLVDRGLILKERIGNRGNRYRLAVSAEQAQAQVALVDRLTGQEGGAR